MNFGGNLVRISDVSDWSLGFRLNCTAAWHRTAVWLLLLYSENGFGYYRDKEQESMILH